MLLKSYFILFIFFSFCLIANNRPNLFIGTGGFGYGCGSNSPAVQIPYSYVRLGPDTTPLQKKIYFQFQHYGGYSNADHAVRAFSHLHLVGAGVIDMGILGILPTKVSSSSIPQPPKDEKVSLYKTTEIAQPGYYSVTIENNIKIELTTTQRCGVHRYQFGKQGYHDIKIMTSYLLQKKSKRQSSTSKCGQNCIEGNVLVYGGFGGRFGGYRIFYHLRLEAQGKNQVFLYNETQISKDKVDASGNNTGAVIRTNAKSLLIYVGLSYVSKKNAKQNLQQQIGDKKFDQIMGQSKKIWKDELSRFQIVAISQKNQEKIDTAIYRTLLTPTIFNDFNRDYLSFSNNGDIKKVPQDMKAVYTDMSLWDVHRTQMPWLLFQDYDRYRDIAKSLILINRQGHYMPKWPFAQGATGCMIGAHANTVLADWIVKLQPQDDSIDKNQILLYMLRNANENTVRDSRPNPEEYKSNGYLSIESSGKSSCCQTLQFSYNDYGISRVAQIIGEQQIKKQFIRRSQFYKNVWNNQSHFFEPKYKNGSFVKLNKREHINIFSNYYVEGDAWHYRFYAPHDPYGLISLFESKQEFIKQLNHFFSRSFSWPTFWLPNPYYWAGNQHDLFSVWLFNYAGRSDLTQKYSRMVIDSQYGNEGDGLPGNDDYATMSAWLIFASLGFYPVPSTQEYVLGSPTIHYARIARKMAEDKIIYLNIGVVKNSEKNYYVEKVLLNGQKRQVNINHKSMNKDNSMLQFYMK